jgi:hypothetical protein
MLHQAGVPVNGWIAIPDPDRVLLEFFNFAIGVVPRPVRSGTALKPYLSRVASVKTMSTDEIVMPLLGDGE